MANNWAIVIGINDYIHHPERKLKYAVNDAQRIGDFLAQQAGFGEANVIRFLGDETHQSSPTYPTCSNLLRALKRDFRPERLSEIDRLWFYFSGHGVSCNGRDYLITSDCLEDELERFALPIDEVIATLRLHQNADIVLVLDACRQVMGKKSFDDSIGEQTIASAQERGITTIFSCDYGQYSYELEGLRQGAFTSALVEGLTQYTLPNSLESYLRQRVLALNSQHRQDHVEQTPRIRVEPTSKAFQPLLPYAVTSADIEVLVNRAKEGEIEEDFEAAKKLWWQVIDVSQHSTQRREAQTAIERINGKIARLGHNGTTRTTPSQPKPYQISEASKVSLQSNIQKNQATLNRSTSITPIVPGQIPELVASNLQEFIFDVLEIDSYGKVISQYADKNWCLIEKIDKVNIEMVFIPGGTFQMGLSESEDTGYRHASPQHTVEIKPFLMSKVPITFAQWREIAQLQPNPRKLKLRPSRFWGANRPVVETSWHDAVEFCGILSQKTGHTYRLPTEAEWEYACRAGTTTPFHFGQTITSDLANYDGTHTFCLEQKGINRAKTLQVGELRFANPFGLFDMHGNVWEWCQDHWHENYYGTPTNGEAWIDSTDNQNRIIRGGSWLNEPSNCSSSYRLWKNSNQVSRHIGFRIVQSF
ncbi:SUMF1/EgtB/PvdO family nonheme iron enzyme [Oculatella sp. LEGE 06141]|uniref:SUMF1/EgtB/PvdO family nonheme iron enzyme n=1 Tax=Oculatella sp. LEGE 06141 TaxID=1828648 RepID=UPI001881CEC6|nr:SUMF1/EgtB/PvdO family nonheme iron enzyme [Oculatella sp. LEGE 06141]MBE9177787.1 SUMF1/EgtB/PvdO family nonheme iron enzyme [Oculatella sp. LEGE 06141]